MYRERTCIGSVCESGVHVKPKRDTDPFEPVIGLEIHVQLATVSKMFCACAAGFGDPPNSRVCPVCLGLPGALPVPNAAAVEQGIRIALALDCSVAPVSRFARKNYFYPDLPKGYQITQYTEPLAVGGRFTLPAAGERRSEETGPKMGDEREIGIVRVHLEEDAARSLHDSARHRDDAAGQGRTRLDFNRSGVPLAEIVTAPDIRSPDEAERFLRELHRLLLFLGVTRGGLEEGALRCDANVSLRPVTGDSSQEQGAKRGSEGDGGGDRETGGERTELKNLNSFAGVRRALEYEIERQRSCLATGGRIEPATLFWDENRREAIPMRGKETSADYRYFPEPDLPPLHLEPALIADLAAALPELPLARQKRYTGLGLDRRTAHLLTAEPAVAGFFEDLLAVGLGPVEAAGWMTGEVLRWLNESGGELADLPIEPGQIREVQDRLDAGVINRAGARTLFRRLCDGSGGIEALIDELELRRIDDDETLRRTAREVLEAHPDETAAWIAGRDELTAFFMGRIMDRTGGRAEPHRAREILADIRAGGSK